MRFFFILSLIIFFSHISLYSQIHQEQEEPSRSHINSISSQEEASSQDSFLQGKIIKDVNVRVDSTVYSDTLGMLTREEKVTIWGEKYGWYKIQLPEGMSCYVYKSYLEAKPEGDYECKADNVNIRSGPSLNSYVLGHLNKGDLVEVRDKVGDFFEITPPPGAGAWVNKKFVKLIEKSQEKEEEKVIEEEAPLLWGELKKRGNRFYLKTEEGVYLIKNKGRDNLSPYLGKKIRIWGRIKRSWGRKRLYIDKIDIMP